MTEAVVRHRFTVDEWDEMGRLGLFGDDARMELVDGEIMEMAPIGPTHAFRVGWLARLFHRLVGDDAVVWVQNPVRLDRYTEVQPDLALLRPPITRYRGRKPRPEDVLLVVEVADTTLRYDEQKAERYAQAGIADVWIIDVNAERVIVAGAAAPFRPGEQVALTALGTEFAVADLLGPADGDR